jgi:hypothetical protein
MFELLFLQRVFKEGFLYQLCLAPHLEQLEVFERVRSPHTLAPGLSNVKRHNTISQERTLRDMALLSKSPGEHIKKAAAVAPKGCDSRFV